MQQPVRAKWDIKSPENYPESDKSCAKFLDRLTTNIKFDFASSAFNPEVGTKEDFFQHVCNSEDKVLDAIKRVGEIIKALLDRAKLIPGLIHSNNMLWRRGELLRKMLEHYGGMSTELESDMRVLLQQLAYMAYQVHTLMNALNVQYDSTTGKLTDYKGTEVDAARANLLGIDNRMKDLLETLAATASGSLYGQKLMLEAPPRFSLTFSKSEFDNANQDAIKKELANLLAETMAALGGTPVSVEDLQKFTTFKQGSLVVTVQLTEDYVKSSGITEEQRKMLQMAMFNIAFMTPDTDKYPTLDALYKAEQPKLPDFEIPSLQPIAENDPLQWKATLQRDFGVDTSKFAAAKPAPTPAPAEVQAEVPAEVPARKVLPAPLGNAAAVALSGVDAASVYYLFREAAEKRNSVLANRKEIGQAVEASVVGGRVTRSQTAAAAAAAAAAGNPPSARREAGDTPRRKSSTRTPRNSARTPRNSARKPRGSARRNRNSARKPRRSRRRSSTRTVRRRGDGEPETYYIDWKAFAAILREKIPNLDISRFKQIRAEDIRTTLLNLTLEGKSDQEQKLIIPLIDNREALLRSITDVPEDEEIPAVPYFLNQTQALQVVAAGLSQVQLVAEVTAKSKMLERIKAIALSNEVKEFIRVRPYNDKDIRATELQLGTIGEIFDRSPDPSVVRGQLATLVEYKNNCLGFKKLFERDASDEQRYFDKFSKFIPRNKVPPKTEWYSTVNGGVFFEPYSYADPKRSGGDKGVAVVPTEMLRLRKQVAAPIEYAWFLEDNKTKTNNDDPNKKRILPTTPKEDTLLVLKQQITRGNNNPNFKQQFFDLKEAWVKDLTMRRNELTELLKASISKNEPQQKITNIQKALDELPSVANEDSFLNEYYKNRVLSEAINAEFVDTVWPVMQIYFGMPLDDGTISDDTKNIVTFFYGASGSGKTFSAEAILKKCFDEIQKHKDEFELKIVSDYNNNLYDYYSLPANVKRKQNDMVYETEIFGKNVGEKEMRLQQFNEMAQRAEFLGWKPAADVIRKSEQKEPPNKFWEGNPASSIKVTDTLKAGESVLSTLGSYNPGIWSNPIKGTITLETTIEPGTFKNDPNLIAQPPKGKGYFKIPQRDPAAFEQFKQDYDKRVVAFRSVTDTGLNPESSRSHLLYIIIRKTKNGQPMDINERGAQFILADFAGTEDLNYLMTEEAWSVWTNWAKKKSFTEQQINGDCAVAGKQVKRDWSCVDLPLLANSTDPADLADKIKLREALVKAWKAIKVKTLVAKQMSERPSLPPTAKEIEDLRATLTAEWTDHLSKPYVFFNESQEIYLPNDENVIKSTLEVTSKTQALKKGMQLNPNRFRVKDEDNDIIICNMVLAMHAESKHINDSLKEIADLIKAQRVAIENKTNGGKADIDSMKRNRVLTKRMVTDVLAGAVTAGSAAVTIGAMNPRRANDWETYKTMVNITDMEAACK